jgi:hypothetical protein
MGILDDAIREHLELKRKHGVTEEELQRQEEEALGPARRDVPQQHEDNAEPAAAEQETALFDGEDSSAEAAPELARSETALHEPPAPEPTSVEPPPVEPPPSGEADEHVQPDAPALAEEPPVAGQPPVGQEPEIGSHQPEPGQEPALDSDDARLGDTQPHGFEAVDEEELEAALEEDELEELPKEEASEEDDLLASDPEHDEQDVLEDTPDFLQETPEHDRLWFEQKPPRDFDFD